MAQMIQLCPYDCYQHTILNKDNRLISARVYRTLNNEIKECPLHKKELTKTIRM